MTPMTDSESSDTHLSDRAALPHQAATGTDSSRSTVLPLIEWSGPEPRVQAGSRERFEVLGLLGAGGMGEVVLARDFDIDRKVALKRLPEKADLGRVLRFVEEIRTVGQLEHPNIVPVHDVGVDACGRYYFVMKHLHGQTLESIITRLSAGDEEAHARFSTPVRIQVMLGVMNALAYAHQQGFIHRDLKPANIMVGPYGEVTVMDWGLAKRLNVPERPRLEEPTAPRTVLQTQLGSVMGTPLYMSPEQARGAHDVLDARSDLYSLAVTFHEFLHLEHYLHGRQGLQAVLEGVQTVHPELHRRSPRGRQFQVPAELDWFLKRGLAKDPAQRYQSVSEMTEELQRILRGECRIQCRRTMMKRVMGEMQKLIDQRPIVAAVIASATVALVLAAVVKSVFVLAS